ncbi:MAG: hypothetical protein ACFE96_16995 [Candidatus Hermodarchaeota archaeon]
MKYKSGRFDYDIAYVDFEGHALEKKIIERIIGQCIEVFPKTYRIKKSIFSFKFDMFGKAVNFCVKYNIPVKEIERIQNIRVQWCL